MKAKKSVNKRVAEKRVVVLQGLGAGRYVLMTDCGWKAEPGALVRTAQCFDGVVTLYLESGYKLHAPCDVLVIQ